MIHSRLIPLAASLVLLAAPRLHGEVLFQQNFDNQETERVEPLTIPGVFPWEGRSAKEFGWLSVEGGLSALTFHDSSALRNQSPTAKIGWRRKDNAPKKLSVSWDFSVPVMGAYQAVHFIGGKGWEDSALVLLFANGNIIVHADKADDARVNLAPYKAGEWQSITLVLDEKTRTFDISLDGKQVLNGHPMLAGAPVVLEAFIVAADAAARERNHEAVLFMDNISVISAP